MFSKTPNRRKSSPNTSANSAPETFLKDPLFLGLSILLGIALLGGAVEKGWNLFQETIPPDRGFILQGVDDSGYFYWLRSAVVDGDFDFENDILLTPSLPENARRQQILRNRLPNGNVANKYFCGWALLNLPPYLAVHSFARVTGIFPANGISPPYLLAIWSWQMMLGLGGMACAWLLLQRIFDRRSAALAVLLGVLASPLSYYMGARVSMVHASAFALTAALYAWTFHLATNRDRRSWAWAFVGVLAGLLVLVRPTSAVYLLYPAVAGLALLRRDSESPARPDPSFLFMAAIVGLAIVSIQPILWWQVYGTPVLWTYSGEGFNWFSPNFAGSLFSNYYGLFNWHPFLLFGAAGLLAAIKARPSLPPSWLAVTLLIVYVNSSWHMWYFGSAFGGRAYEGLILILMAGFAWLIHHFQDAPIPRRFLLTAGSAFAAWNLVLQALYQMNRIPRETPVSWTQRIQAFLDWIH